MLHKNINDKVEHKVIRNPGIKRLKNDQHFTLLVALFDIISV